jgi:hypothetical protein
MLTIPLSIKLIFIAFFISQNYFVGKLFHKLTLIPHEITSWFAVWLSLLCIHYTDTIFKRIMKKKKQK